MKRREFFKRAGVGSAGLISLPVFAEALARPAWARSPQDQDGLPADTFSILLSGPYKPVTRCPDLGLANVNVCDGTFTTTKIFPVFGLPDVDRDKGDRTNRSNGRSGDAERAIGNFFVGGGKAAYDLPGGALAMAFTANNLKPAPDGQGGTYLVGTLQLTITDATGIFQSFIGGHNGMVDILHHLANGAFVEHCFCVISRP